MKNQNRKQLRTREQIQKDREDFVHDRQSRLNEKVSILQGMVYSSLLAVILGLDTDSDGKIKFTVKNITQANKINSVFISMAQVARKGIIQWLINGVSQLIGMNATYFKTMERYDYRTVDNRAADLLLRNFGYNVKTGEIIGGSWLDNLASAEDVKQKVFQRVRTSIGVMDHKEFQKAFRNEFLDTSNGLGLLSKHYRTHTGNLYASLDRQTQDLYKQKLGLKYAVFSGVPMKDSREWCLKRKGHVYTEDVIESWNAESWPEKIKGADVKIALGGYNCTDTLNWVSEAVAMSIAEKTGGLNAYS